MPKTKNNKSINIEPTTQTATPEPNLLQAIINNPLPSRQERINKKQESYKELFKNALQIFI